MLNDTFQKDKLRLFVSIVCIMHIMYVIYSQLLEIMDAREQIFLTQSLFDLQVYIEGVVKKLV